MGPVTTLPWIVAFGVVAVGIIFSNLLMTAVFTKSRAVRRMRTALFLMGMTAADLIVGVAAIPMYMALLWPGRRLGSQFADSYMSIEMVSSFASLFLLAVIALERVYSVFRPYRHRVLSRTPYWVGLFMSWFLAALPVVFSPPLSSFISRRDHLLLVLAFMAAVPIVIVVSYVALWLKMKTTRVEGLHQRRDLQERKLAKTLAILTGVFLATWLPFSIFNVLYLIDLFLQPIMQGLSLEARYHIAFACKVLHYSNSFMNPVIYTFRISQVRSALGKIFRGHNDEADAPGGLQMVLRRREMGGGGESEGGTGVGGGEGEGAGMESEDGVGVEAEVAEGVGGRSAGGREGGEKGEKGGVAEKDGGVRGEKGEVGGGEGGVGGRGGGVGGRESGGGGKGGEGGGEGGEGGGKGGVARRGAEWEEERAELEKERAELEEERAE